jgi:hypothetical protein
MTNGGGSVVGSMVNGINGLRLWIADEVLRILENTRHTKYQHDICIDEATGTYNVDCSGFVEYVLRYFATNHLKGIPPSAGEKRLLAYNFQEFFSSLPTETADGWRQIPDLRDARRGDLIAWYLRDELPGDTGHVFWVAEQPVLVDPATPTTMATMAVMAYDSSDIRHYDDSRGPSPGQFKTGLGWGILHLQIDSAGKPCAYQFGLGDPMKSDSRIAIARLEPFDV